MSKQDGTGAKAAKTKGEIEMAEVEMSKLANDPGFQAQELDNLVTLLEKKLRDTPKDAAHAEERAMGEHQLAVFRRILRGEEK